MVQVRRVLLLAVGALAASAVVFYSGLAFAGGKSITADQVKIKTPTYKPSFDEFTPPLGEYKYEVSWQGIPAAGLTATVTREDDTYRIVTTAKTYKAIDLFYKLRYRAEGVISAYTLRPKKTMINHRENSRVKNTEIKFEGDKIKSVYTKLGKPSEILNFETDNYSH